jgi:hypothetical protein
MHGCVQIPHSQTGIQEKGSAGFLGGAEVSSGIAVTCKDKALSSNPSAAKKC